MSKTGMKINVKTAAKKAMFNVKKYSPEILVVAGIAGVVTSAVMACKATMKVNEVLAETKENINKVHDVMADQGISEKEYSKEDSARDLAIIYGKAGVKLAKLYGPAVALCGLSLTAIVCSNNILRKRNVALAAAYTAIDTSYKQYRSRVIEKFGENVDREMKYGIKAVQIEEKTVDENGKKKTVKKTVEVVNPYDYSDYARFFDVGNPNWEKDSEYNLMFLKRQQAYANDKLKANGYLFLNEVYDMLGIPKSKAGQVVGWIYDPENGTGDNYVDFGIYNVNREAARDFVNGYERTILLDFNVDGNIWEKM